jgi:peptidoglycan/xylan/chitin deacetylase (PgdA/CDA1 family)
MDFLTSWDDACYSDCKLADLLAKYEMKGIFFWQNNLKNPFNLKRCQKFLTLSDCKNISKNFDVGSHTVNHHYLTEISIKDARDEIINSKIFWQNTLGKNISWFCYPRGRNNISITQIVKEQYEYARLTELIKDDTNKNKILMKPNLHIGVDRKEYGDKNWFDYGIELVKTMKINNCKTFHMIGHSWELDFYNQWQKLENFLKNIKDIV